jgi:S-adenosylmethionine:tRNA ribosyltransferase-isomerase
VGRYNSTLAENASAGPSRVKTSEFHYDLPPEAIAQHPLPERDASRMLLLNRNTGAIQDRMFREFPDLLRGDELIVINNARVIPARLLGRRLGVHSEPPGHSKTTSLEFLQSEIEVFLVREIEPEVWEALVRPGRKIRVSEKIVFTEAPQKTGSQPESESASDRQSPRLEQLVELEATVETRGEFGLRRLRFRSRSGSTVRQALDILGHVPLPPYIRRPDEPSDRERYQTIFARRGAAIAAPTASLHFSPAILQRLHARHIEIAEITLEVGLGTFEPVRTEDIDAHQLHTERYDIPSATAAAIHHAKRAGRPILAIGTTVVRALEDAAQKSLPLPLIHGPADASLFLLPGSPFRVVDQLLTNFHLPESTLLALVAAFAGKQHTLNAYQHAVGAHYRFYSYGDCMLIR